MSDGTFGTTAEVGPMDPEIVDAVENHRVDPLTHLMWRRADLDFRSIDHLLRSLETRPPHPGLIRQQEAEDHQSLQQMARDPEIADLAHGRDRVALLWEVCQVPDFRKLMTDAHVRLLGQMYRYLAVGGLAPGRLPVDWVAGQLARLDRVDGDIDHLTQRIAHIRTWAFVAHRGDWLADPVHWQARAQAIEDRLSDALHEALTQRFIDRRHAALHRHLQSGARLYGTVTEANEVLVEGHPVGTLHGFAFTPLAEARDLPGRAETKPLLAAARRALGPAVAARIRDLAADDDQQFRLDDAGSLLWRNAPVARLASGDAPLRPQIQLLHDDLLDGGQRQAIERRLKQWLGFHLRRRLKPLFQAADADLPPGPRGVIYQVLEHLGAVPREEIAAQLAMLGRDERRQLAGLGLRLGRETVWLQRLNDRRQRRLLLLLHATYHRLPLRPTLPQELDLPSHGLVDATARVGGQRLVAGRLVGFERLEHWSTSLHRLASTHRLKLNDPGLASLLGVPPEMIEPILRALGFVRNVRADKNSFARRRKRQLPPAAAVDPQSPFAVLAALKVER